eukprot:8197264-Lingulodinium_polyedra.AAC.1
MRAYGLDLSQHNRGPLGPWCLHGPSWPLHACVVVARLDPWRLTVASPKLPTESDVCAGRFWRTLV